MNEQSRRIRSKYITPQAIERYFQALKRCGHTPAACRISSDGAIVFDFIIDGASSVEAELHAWESTHVS